MSNNLMTYELCKELFNSLTPSQKLALAAAERDGATFAGRTEHKGRREYHAMSTIKALSARGLFSMQLNPDGGTMGTLTELGRAALLGKPT